MKLPDKVGKVVTIVLAVIFAAFVLFVVGTVIYRIVSGNL